METRIVFHIDFDYFYAQCEEIRKPELKLKPVCVCVFSDRGGDSGAIATANYAARKFGVKSGKDCFFYPIDVSEKMLDKHPDPEEFSDIYGVERDLVGAGKVKLVLCGEERGEI